MDSGLVVPVFNQGDDPIACLNKAMAFLTAVASSRIPSTNNQFRTSSNSRNQSTIQDDKVTMQQVQGRQGQSYDGTGNKGNDTRGNNAGGQARVVKCYNCQGEGHMARKRLIRKKNNESLTAELERYKERVKNFEQRLNIDLSTREKLIDSQIDDMINEKLALKQQVDSLEQNLSNQIKEKESLLQTFTVFKNESKEKKSKYTDKEINLEKKIKQLDNIVYKVEEMLRLQGLGSNTPTSVPYIDDEIMAIVRWGKQRGHISGVGRVLAREGIDVFRSDDKISQLLMHIQSQPEIGSGGAGDDKPGNDEDADEDEEDEDS
ncbi:integrase, catalytic region, zinc finger, CCHC-type containing protein [Tanacetum coccineum]